MSAQGANSWDIKRPVGITKFELLCLLRQYGLELGRPDVSEQRIKDIIARMVELRREFERPVSATEFEQAPVCDQALAEPTGEK